jgi:hypothetical protein
VLAAAADSGASAPTEWRFRQPDGTALHAEVVATNLLDQRRYEAFGASVIGRRVLGRATYTW